MWPFTLKKKKAKHPPEKVGIAFGGGGARGFAHLGVIKALRENNIEFDYVAGTSAGAVAGALYAAGLSFEDIYKVAKNVTKDKIVTSKLFFMPSGHEGFLKQLKDIFGKDILFSDLKTPFSALSVDLHTGKQVDLNVGSVANAVAASCSVPGVFKPVEMGGMLLMDGSLQNTIPVSICREHGCKTVIGVDVSSERSTGLKGKGVIDVLSASIKILINASAAKGILESDIIISPETKRFKFSKIEGVDELIEEGYKATIELMPQIKELFGGKNANKK